MVGKSKRRLWLPVAILLLLFAVAAAWNWTPLGELITLRKIISWGVSLRDNPARPLIVLGGYVIGSLLLIPITVLILATAIVFGPLLGSAYSFAGCLLGAAVTYGAGHLMGKDLVQRIATKRWKKIESAMGQSGIMAVAALRLLPIAPFTVVNIVSGAFKVPVWDYLIGSFLGLAPGIILTNFFAHQFARAVRHPGIGSYTLLAASVIVTILGIVWLRRRLRADAADKTAPPRKRNPKKF